MEVTTESKYVVLFFLQFITDGRTGIHSGKESLNMQSPKVSNAQEDTALRWPKGIVTYYLDNLAYDNFISQRVRMAMNVLETASCVRFKPTLIKPAGNITWIHFTNPQGERNCVHEPKFMNNGEIIVVLGLDCLKEREILHALLHAVGFKDEVSHPQRDQYIRVMWNNIQPEYRHLYRIRSSGDVFSSLLVEYDPLSIMHFHDRAFSMNGHATVMPLVPGLLINPSNDLSQLDKMRLRLLFDHECNKRKVGDMIDACRLLLTNTVKLDDASSINSRLVETDYVDEIEEVEGKNNTQLKNIENNYDLNELDPDTDLERQVDKESAKSSSEQDDEGAEKYES